MSPGRGQAGACVRFTEHVIEQIAQVSDEGAKPRSSGRRMGMESHGVTLSLMPCRSARRFASPGGQRSIPLIYLHSD